MCRQRSAWFQGRGVWPLSRGRHPSTHDSIINSALNMLCLCWLLCLLVSICKCNEAIDCTDSGKTNARTTTIKLKRHLLCGYDKYLRPVILHNNRTDVNVLLAPRIISFDDEHNLFYLKAWMSMAWMDSLLIWDKLDYDNIDLIHLDTSMVWVPDLSVYNAQTEVSLDQETAPVIVHSRGQIQTFMAPEITGHCIPKWDNWPYDIHECIISMGSRTYLGSTLNFNKPLIMMSFLLENKDWEILQYNATRNKTIYASKNETDPLFLITLKYQFTLRRHASVYVASYVIPGVVMIIMSLCLLWIPADKVERTAILCTLVVVQSLFLQYLAYKIPSNGNTTPFIVCFYRDCLVLTGILIIETVACRVMLTLDQIPDYLRTIFQVIAKNKTLQFIFTSDLDPKSAAKLMEGINEEGSTLVETEDNSKQWGIFVNIIHRVLFILLLPTYILLSLNLMPLNVSVSFY